MGVTPLQGWGGLWGRLTWASARRTRSSPGYHIGGFQPRAEEMRVGGDVVRITGARVSTS